MTPEEYETAAKVARRKADVAKHRPLEDLDTFGDAQSLRSGDAQIDLMKLAIELQTAYAAELQHLWKVVATLRAEAMYWRQKYDEATKPPDA